MVRIMELNRNQWVALVLIIVVDSILAVLSYLALVPVLAEPNMDSLLPDLGLLMSPLAVLPLLLVPVLLGYNWAWPGKLEARSFLLPLRLALGYEFLHSGLDKLLSTTYLSSPGLIAFGASSAPSEWVRSVLSAMLGSYQPFLLVIAVGELLIGLSMYPGAFTRLGAIGGLVIQWTFLILLGWTSVSTFGINFVGSLAFVVIGLYAAGRFIGLDQFIGPKLDQGQHILLRIVAWFTR
jgi:thiosulfate dehydrogenase [quinone] large subunit